MARGGGELVGTLVATAVVVGVAYFLWVRLARTGTKINFDLSQFGITFGGAAPTATLSDLRRDSIAIEGLELATLTPTLAGVN